MSLSYTTRAPCHPKWGLSFAVGPAHSPQPMSHTRVHLFRPLSIYRKATHRIYVLFSRTIEFKIVIICISMDGFLYSHSLIVYYDFTFLFFLLFCSFVVILFRWWVQTIISVFEPTKYIYTMYTIPLCVWQCVLVLVFFSSSSSSNQFIHIIYWGAFVFRFGV